MTIEGFEGQAKQISFLKTPITMFDNDDYLNWMGTLEGKVWHRMYRFIVRAPMITKLNQKIHESYYKNGMLAMYKEQKEIAEFFGARDNKCRLSRAVKSMIDKKIIIPHADKWNNRKITIYELGTHDKGPDEHETLHLFKYFIKFNADKKLKKMLA
jgi:hypothetical protein